MDVCVPLRDACDEIGLRCRCEFSHLESRFTITTEHGLDGPTLHLRLRRDAGLDLRVVERRADPPGLLLEIIEETVQREPVMHLWLPHRNRHQFLVHRRDGVWACDRLPEGGAAGSIGEALASLGPDGEPPT